ncbi:hypothetical protein [Adhaeribacter aquaticus]|uniref:hypothetical protein n=1 Tax=Adhaeribacter aquaticus TaxID=299567 RepID=UPI00042A936C|nr:hypothetical protein [Adhaeribacter aquaticus]
MVYNRICISTDDTLNTYNTITQILGIAPTEFKSNNKFDNSYGVWTYSVDINDEEPYFDFINNFLDILEPKFDSLEKIGIQKDDISFWHLYEYDQQCSMEFQPLEMKRLGESGITLCIDCWEKASE